MKRIGQNTCVEIQSGSIRVVAKEQDGRYFVDLQVGRGNATWRTVLVSGLYAPSNIWTSCRELFCEDPIVEWVDRGGQIERAEGFFDRVEVAADGKTLVLSGQAGCHAVEGRVSLVGPGQIHVVVTDTVSASPGTVRLARLMSQFYFVPDGKAARTAEPLDFAWLPALHKREEHVCGDHFFRSPAVAVVANGCYAALVPDLDEFAEHRTISHALDLRVADTKIEAPRLSYGICPSVIDDHVYSKHDAGHAETIDGPVLTYSFDVFFGECEASEDVAEMISSYLWSAYGHRTLQDIRPQVLPFEEYGRRYTYAYELPRSVRRVTIGAKICAGIDNPHRRGANFHAWENDLHVGYGIRYYGEKWGDESLVETAAEILNLSLSAPRNQGAFPCIYNFQEQTYEGTLFWTARSADPYHGYDSAAMSVSAWWQLYWHQDLMESGEILDAAVSYAHFLREAQLPSGAIPTYFLQDLSPAKQLLESATTAVSGAVLAKLALLTSDAEIRGAAMHAGHYVEREIVPGLVFDDFETYYSCSPKPLHAIDYWTGIRPHCNLSLQWACDQFLALYRLSGEDRWLRKGEYLLNVLSLYQQVWNPSHLSGYLFGGFGVMNTDGEWNDGRQARFVPTYADYYEATGKSEYLERAVAACRASFALMDISENHANEINEVIMHEEGAGLGYAPENIHHCGEGSGYSWSGMNWSSGGGLGASAYLERHFGNVWVDGRRQEAVPIDGATARIDCWDGPEVRITVESALESLPMPYRESRSVLVRFGGLWRQEYDVSIKDQHPQGRSREELERGITVDL